MKLDLPTLVVAGAILALAVLNRFGVIGDELAYAGFISVLLGGFVFARRQVCRLECAS